MDVSRRTEQSKDGEGTKGKVTKSCGKQSKEKPALSPIEEETDSPDSSGDSAINFRGIEPVALAKNYPYDLRVSLCKDYEEVLRVLEDEEEEDEEEEDEEDEEEEEEEPEEGKPQAETPPFLTARNGSDHEAGSKSGDSNSTTSYERSTPEDEDEADDDNDEDDDDNEDSSFPGESSSGDVDYRYNDLEDNLQRNTKDRSMSKSPKKIKKSRSKSAPASGVIESREINPEAVSMTFEWLKARVIKSEKDIDCLKKKLLLEKSRNRKLAKHWDEDRNVMKESLRIDLELWIKKLNDGLKGYLGEWQQRERLRLNEEISRISDLYSQEIAKSLKISLKEWQTEDSKKLFDLMDKRDRSRQDREKTNVNAFYAKIQNHLESLEKRNRKSYASFRKQIDKWEDRLKEEVVKLCEEDLKKLRQQLDTWQKEERNKIPDSSTKKEKSKECFVNETCSFPGAEALLQVEENLLKRLRDSSSKDLRRTEQIVRTELKVQRRELAKRMNEKIAELWMAFEEFGFGSSSATAAKSVGVTDRTRPRRLSVVASTAVGRNDLEDCRAGLAGTFMKDATLNSDVSRWVGGGGKIAVRPDGSTRSSTDDVEDGDRDYREDEDDDDDDDEVEENLKDEASVIKSAQQIPEIITTVLDSNSMQN